MFGLRINLRKKFILAFLIITLVPLLISLFLVLYQEQNFHRNNLLKIKKQSAETGTRQIASFFTLQFKALDNVELISPETFLDPSIRGLLLDRILFTNDNIEEIAVLNPQGREVARKHRIRVIRDEDLRERSGSKEFQTIREQKRYIGPMFFDRNRPFISIAKQITNPRQRFEGAIVAHIDARRMTHVIKSISSPKERTRAYIVDEDGTVIAHQDISQVLAKTNLAHIDIIQKIKEGQEAGIIVAEDYRNEQGEKVLGVASRIILSFEEDELRTSMFVIVEQDDAFAFAPVRQLTRILILLLLGTLLLSVVLAWVLGSRVVGPIELLHRAAQQFELGKLFYRVFIRSGDEIEDLAGQFNAMAETIRRNIANLEGERNKLAIILEGITDGVVAVDTKGNIIEYNRIAEDLVGISRKQVLGKSIDTVLNIEKNGVSIASAEYYPATNDGYEGTIYSATGITLKRPDGKTRTVNIVSGIIHEGKTVNLGFILTIHDVTEEKLLERLKNEFLEIAAHQLRTPLSAIKWALSMLEENTRDRLEKEENRMLKNAYQSNERMISLVNDLLTASRVEGKQRQLMFRTVHIGEIVRSIVQANQPGAQKDGKTISLHAPKNLPSTQGDEKLLTTVIQNLLTNALAYSPKESRISVSVNAKDHELEVITKDSGIGIPQKDQDSLFTKFYRGSNARRMRPDGSGLGLFIVKNIIEDHGGKIWFESKEGKGTTFTFTLPIREKPTFKNGKPSHV